MKILLVNSKFGGGGVTTYAEELIKCLSQDHELTVVLPDDSLRPIKTPGVKVLYHETRKLTRADALFFIRLINEELKPDLVISSLGIVIPIIVPYLNDNIRVMTVSHSGRYFHSEYSAFNHRYVDNIVAASSDYNKRYLERKFRIKDKTKVRVIYNFMASDSELEKFKDIKKENDPIQIVYAGGGRSATKNPDLVLKVLCELLKTDLDFRFIWTGNTMLPLVHLASRKIIKVRDIRQFVKKDDRVVFPGKIPSKAAFNQLIASANILISPSRNEGCSMLLLEALRSGAMCMVCDYPHGNREIVEKGECGFVIDHKKPMDAYHQLVEVIRHKEEYADCYDHAYATYKNWLSYPVWKASIESLIAEKTPHEHRKSRVSGIRISYDIMRMNWLRKNSEIRRFFQITLPCLGSFFSQYVRMKWKKEFSDTDNMM